MSKKYYIERFNWKLASIEFCLVWLVCFFFIFGVLSFVTPFYSFMYSVKIEFSLFNLLFSLFFGLFVSLGFCVMRSEDGEFVEKVVVKHGKI